MRCLLVLRVISAPPTTPTAALNTETPIFVRVSRWPFLAVDACSALLVFAVGVLRAAVDPDFFAVLFALVVRERELLDPLERDRLVALFELPLRELAPDPLVPFLDVEPEFEVSVRLACVRPRLFPRRD